MSSMSRPTNIRSTPVPEAPAEVGGAGAPGLTVNLPLPPGATGDVVRAGLDSEARGAIENFVPDWVLVSCGFDAHHADPLSNLELSSGDYAELARVARGFAPPGRLALFLEGGTTWPRSSRAWRRHSPRCWTSASMLRLRRAAVRGCASCVTTGSNGSARIDRAARDAGLSASLRSERRRRCSRRARQCLGARGRGIRRCSRSTR